MAGGYHDVEGVEGLEVPLVGGVVDAWSGGEVHPDRGVDSPHVGGAILGQRSCGDGDGPLRRALGQGGDGGTELKGSRGRDLIPPDDGGDHVGVTEVDPVQAQVLVHGQSQAEGLRSLDQVVLNGIYIDDQLLSPTGANRNGNRVDSQVVNSVDGGARVAGQGDVEVQVPARNPVQSHGEQHALGLPDRLPREGMECGRGPVGVVPYGVLVRDDDDTGLAPVIDHDPVCTSVGSGKERDLEALPVLVHLVRQERDDDVLLHHVGREDEGAGAVHVVHAGSGRVNAEGRDDVVHPRLLGGPAHPGDGKRGVGPFACPETGLVLEAHGDSVSDHL